MAMWDNYIFILNIILISVFEIFIMIKYLIKKKSREFFGNLFIYAVVMAFLLYEHYSDLKVPSFILTFSVASVLGHSFIGKYHEVYYTSNVYDRYLHLFGSFSFSLLAYSVIDFIFKPANENWLYTSLYVMAIGITIGVFFEIAEFIHDICFTNQIMNQHGLRDTDFDLIYDVIGAFIAGALSVIILI